MHCGDAGACCYATKLSRAVARDCLNASCAMLRVLCMLDCRNALSNEYIRVSEATVLRMHS